MRDPHEVAGSWSFVRVLVMQSATEPRKHLPGAELSLPTLSSELSSSQG